MAQPSSIDERLRALETRLAALEQVVGAAPAGLPPVAAAAPGPSVVAGDPDAWSLRTALPPARAAATAGSTPADPAAPTSAADGRSSLADLEARLSGRLLAWAGGAALVLGAMFFLSLAFTRGWIGPEARVVLGLIGSAVALGGGGRLAVRGHGAPAVVLVAVGIATGLLSLYAASVLYAFVPPEVALLGCLALAVVAAGIAIRLDSWAVAALGLLAVTVSPPLMGAAATLATASFLGVVLVGTTVIAVRRGWPWLPLIAFLTTAGQLDHWLGNERSLAIALLATAGYWALNAVAAAGEALTRPRRRVHEASATLLVSASLLAIHETQRLLEGNEPWTRLAALVALAAAAAVLAVPGLRRSGPADAFATLAGGTSAGILAIGVGLELGGAARPIGWTGLGLGLAWVGARFRHQWAGLGAFVLAALAATHLFTIDYSPFEIATSRLGTPFASPAGIATAILAASIVVAGWVAGRDLRLGRAPVVVALVAAAVVLGYAGWFELAPDAAVVWWAALAAGLAGLVLFGPTDRFATTAALTGSWSIAATGGLVTMAALVPIDRLAIDVDAPIVVSPLLNGGSAALVAIAVALTLSAVVLREPGLRIAAGLGDPRRVVVVPAIVAGVLLVHLGSAALIDVFAGRLTGGPGDAEVATQAQVALSIGWVVAGALILVGGLLRDLGPARAFGLGLLGLATLKVFLVDLATVDVAYRVLSLLGLGLVLIAMSFATGRFRRARRAAPGEPVDGVV